MEGMRKLFLPIFTFAAYISRILCRFLLPALIVQIFHMVPGSLMRSTVIVVFGRILNKRQDVSLNRRIPADRHKTDIRSQADITPGIDQKFIIAGFHLRVCNAQRQITRKTLAFKGSSLDNKGMHLGKESHITIILRVPAVKGDSKHRLI